MNSEESDMNADVELFFQKSPDITNFELVKTFWIDSRESNNLTEIVPNETELKQKVLPPLSVKEIASESVGSSCSTSEAQLPDEILNEPLDDEVFEEVEESENVETDLLFRQPKNSSMELIFTISKPEQLNLDKMEEEDEEVEVDLWFREPTDIRFELVYTIPLMEDVSVDSMEKLEDVPSSEELDNVIEEADVDEAPVAEFTFKPTENDEETVTTELVTVLENVGEGARDFIEKVKLTSDDTLDDVDDDAEEESFQNSFVKSVETPIPSDDEKDDGNENAENNSISDVLNDVAGKLVQLQNPQRENSMDELEAPGVVTFVLGSEDSEDKTADQDSLYNRELEEEASHVGPEVPLTDENAVLHPEGESKKESPSDNISETVVQDDTVGKEDVLNDDNEDAKKVENVPEDIPVLEENDSTSLNVSNNSEPAKTSETVELNDETETSRKEEIEEKVVPPESEQEESDNRKDQEETENFDAQAGIQSDWKEMTLPVTGENQEKTPTVTDSVENKEEDFLEVQTEPSVDAQATGQVGNIETPNENPELATLDEASEPKILEPDFSDKPGVEETIGTEIDEEKGILKQEDDSLKEEEPAETSPDNRESENDNFATDKTVEEEDKIPDTVPHADVVEKLSNLDDDEKAHNQESHKVEGGVEPSHEEVTESGSCVMSDEPVTEVIEKPSEEILEAQVGENEEAPREENPSVEEEPPINQPDDDLRADLPVVIQKEDATLESVLRDGAVDKVTDEEAPDQEFHVEKVIIDVTGDDPRSSPMVHEDPYSNFSEASYEEKARVDERESPKEEEPANPSVEEEEKSPTPLDTTNTEKSKAPTNEPGDDLTADHPVDIQKEDATLESVLRDGVVDKVTDEEAPDQEFHVEKVITDVTDDDPRSSPVVHEDPYSNFSEASNEEKARIDERESPKEEESEIPSDTMNPEEPQSSSITVDNNVSPPKECEIHESDPEIPPNDDNRTGNMSEPNFLEGISSDEPLQENPNEVVLSPELENSQDLNLTDFPQELSFVDESLQAVGNPLLRRDFQPLSEVERYLPHDDSVYDTLYEGVPLEDSLSAEYFNYEADKPAAIVVEQIEPPISSPEENVIVELQFVQSEIKKLATSVNTPITDVAIISMNVDAAPENNDPNLPETNEAVHVEHLSSEDKSAKEEVLDEGTSAHERQENSPNDLEETNLVEVNVTTQESSDKQENNEKPDLEETQQQEGEVLPKFLFPEAKIDICETPSETDEQSMEQESDLANENVLGSDVSTEETSRLSENETEEHAKEDISEPEKNREEDVASSDEVTAVIPEVPEVADATINQDEPGTKEDAGKVPDEPTNESLEPEDNVGESNQLDDVLETRESSENVRTTREVDEVEEALTKTTVTSQETERSSDVPNEDEMGNSTTEHFEDCAQKTTEPHRITDLHFKIPVEHEDYGNDYVPFGTEPSKVTFDNPLEDQDEEEDVVAELSFQPVRQWKDEDVISLQSLKSLVAEIGCTTDIEAIPKSSDEPAVDSTLKILKVVPSEPSLMELDISNDPNVIHVPIPLMEPASKYLEDMIDWIIVDAVKEVSEMEVVTESEISEMVPQESEKESIQTPEPLADLNLPLEDDEKTPEPEPMPTETEVPVVLTKVIPVASEVTPQRPPRAPKNENKSRVRFGPLSIKLGRSYSEDQQKELAEMLTKPLTVLTTTEKALTEPEDLGGISPLSPSTLDEYEHIPVMDMQSVPHSPLEKQEEQSAGEPEVIKIPEIVEQLSNNSEEQPKRIPRALVETKILGAGKSVEYVGKEEEDDSECLDSIGDLSERTIQRFNTSIDDPSIRRDSFSSISSFGDRQKFQTAIENIRQDLLPFQSSVSQYLDSASNPSQLLVNNLSMDSPSDLSPNAPPVGFENTAQYLEKMQQEDRPSAEGSIDSSGFEKVDHESLEDFGAPVHDPMQKSVFGSLGADADDLKSGTQDDGFVFIEKNEASEGAKKKMTSHHDDVIEKNYFGDDAKTAQLLESPIAEEARKLVQSAVESASEYGKQPTDESDDIGRELLDNVQHKVDNVKETVTDTLHKAYDGMGDFVHETVPQAVEDFVKEAEQPKPESPIPEKVETPEPLVDIHDSVDQVHNDIDNYLRSGREPTPPLVEADEDAHNEHPRFGNQTPEEDETTFDRNGPLTIPQEVERAAAQKQDDILDDFDPLVTSNTGASFGAAVGAAAASEPLTEEEIFGHQKFETVPRPPTPPKDISDEDVKPSTVNLGPSHHHSHPSSPHHSILKHHGEAWIDFKTVPPCVLDVIYWRDPKKSGVVLVLALVALFVLAKYPLLTVITYSLLAALVAAAGFRIFKKVESQIKKTDAEHPFSEILSQDLSLPQEKVHAQADVFVEHATCIANTLKKLVFVESPIESIKFGLVLWSLTYVASWFSGFTLAILGLLGVFSIPKVYESNQEAIDPHLETVKGHLTNVQNLINEKLPFLRGDPVAAEEKKDQ